MSLLVLLQLTCIFFIVKPTHELSRKRYRRQSVVNHQDLPYGGWGAGYQNPSGGSPGAYYGSGHNPNYGEFRPNSGISGGINQVSYNDYVNHYQSQQQSYPNNNVGYNAVWQRPSGSFYSNNNNPSQSFNRYPPGSQGWYATGGNYEYNDCQLLLCNPIFCVICLIFSLRAYFIS